MKHHPAFLRSMLGSPGFPVQRYLMAPVNLDSKIAGSLADRHEVLGGDHYFALRYENAIDCPAIQDAGDSTSQIFSDNRIHHVSRQADYCRQRRLSADHSHFDELPEPHSRKPSHHLSGTGRNKNLRDKYYYCGVRAAGSGVRNLAS